jgi:hypothetical protein
MSETVMFRRVDPEAQRAHRWWLVNAGLGYIFTIMFFLQEYFRVAASIPCTDYFGRTQGDIT